MPESQNTEWKESWREDYWRWVCGFANAQGGTLVIGRNDSGEAVGLVDAARLLEELPNKARDLLGVVVEVNLHQEGDKDLLEIVTPAYPNPISYRGHYYQRSGSTLQELKGAALDRFLLRCYGRTWDGSPLPGVTVSDLSTVALARFRRLAEKSGRLDAAALTEPDAALLDKLKLTEGKYLKRATVLLFHPDPLTFVTSAFVKVGFFRPGGDLVYHDEINGDLFTQAVQTLDLIYTKYLKAAITYDDIVRVESFPVPRAALREAVLNALVHRDYMMHTPIQIRIYDDKVSVWNPAVLPEGWTQETLLTPHSSHPFNPDIANVFFRAGEIEAWGRGIERIFTACREAGTPVPQVRFDAGGVWTEFAFDAAYLRVIRGVERASNPVTPQVTPQVTHQVTPQVTPEVERLLAVLKGEMSRTAIMSALNLKDRMHFQEHYQQTAIAQGLIEMTLPDKPTSRLQKYRLTAAGQALLHNLIIRTPH
jgi:ATP-dependent DNA helicase RecG